MHTLPDLLTLVVLLHVQSIGFYYPDQHSLVYIFKFKWRIHVKFCSVVSSIYGFDPGPIESKHE